jgi:hypothetical protein
LREVADEDAAMAVGGGLPGEVLDQRARAGWPQARFREGLEDLPCGEIGRAGGVAGDAAGSV